MRRFRRLLIVAGVAGGLALPGLTAQPAGADCLAFEVYTFRQGDWGTRYYSPGVGPYYCVPFSDLGWPTVKRTRVQHQQDVSPLPNGTPSGAGAAVFIPAP